ncbi:MAG: asparagine synthase, partial [Aquincola sp.]|nr:asparagine synthase [Aquincola sp.]
MTTISDSLALGHPRFADASLAHTAAEEGALAAWRQALRRAPADAPVNVKGDFAVALQDPDCSFAAVDRFAVRTLCWRVDRGVLRVAERADQLVDDSPEIDPQAIYDYLFFHAIPSPRTIFRGVHRLPPGHCLRFDGGQPDVRPYWRPEFRESKPAFAPLRDEFRSLLR